MNRVLGIRAVSRAASAGQARDLDHLALEPATIDAAAAELGLQPASPGRYCLCRRPRPGPLYWNYRCRRCDGTIVGWRTRRKLRKAVSNPRWFLPDRPPTEEEIEIAREEARKRGWLTDAGWNWEEKPGRGRCATCGQFGHDATEHDGDHDRSSA